MVEQEGCSTFMVKYLHEKKTYLLEVENDMTNKNLQWRMEIFLHFELEWATIWDPVLICLPVSLSKDSSEGKCRKANLWELKIIRSLSIEKEKSMNPFTDLISNCQVETDSTESLLISLSFFNCPAKTTNHQCNC